MLKKLFKISTKTLGERSGLVSNLEFVRRLMKKNSKAVGFIPMSAVKKACNENRLFIYSVNNESIGYLLFGPVKKGKDVTIWQMCVDEKKRKKGFGKKLFKRLYKLALEKGAKGIRLRCARDLPANYFWESVGLKIISTISSKNKRRKINIYYLPLR